MDGKGRRWIGVEFNDAAVIVERLTGADTAHHTNTDIIHLGKERAA